SNQDGAILNNLHERNYWDKRPKKSRFEPDSMTGPKRPRLDRPPPVAKRRRIPKRSALPRDYGLSLSKAGRIIVAVSAERGTVGPGVLLQAPSACNSSRM